jgi:hypothetical protein
MVVLPEKEYKRMKKSVGHVEQQLLLEEVKPDNKEEEMAIATNQPTMENIVETAKMRQEIAPTPITTTTETSVMAEDIGDEKRAIAAVEGEGGLLESKLIRALPQGVGKRAIVIIDALNRLYPSGWYNPNTLKLLQGDASVLQLLNYVARDAPLVGQRALLPPGLNIFLSMLHRAVSGGHLAIKKLGKHVRDRVETSASSTGPKNHNLIGQEANDDNNDSRNMQIGGGKVLNTKYLVW